MNERKVVVSFKCFQDLKDDLVNAANKNGYTVSAFIDMIISSIEDLDNALKVTDEEKKYNELNVNYLYARRKVFFFESRLKKFLLAEKGKRYKYVDFDGNHIDITINDYADIFNIMVSTFKIK
jgi:hypothetical protein